MSGAVPGGDAPKTLVGGQLAVAALLLAAANFLVVLDTTIANVSVPNIAGGLAVSSSQGTFVITSYSVAEAVTVPLTGWLAGRFGTVRTFVIAMLGFGICSALCGFAQSLGMLVLFRVLQGLAGGPLMPLSQTLLLRVFPKEKAPAAMGIWAMTTLVAPILGPILGGTLCDNWGWPFIFYINVPIALLCAVACWGLLKGFETATVRPRFDLVGLVLLIVWVGALQIMLDEGKDLDWFSSSTIVVLAIVAVIGLAAFLIWELTEAHPVVDLKVFRHRGFAMAVLTISLGFGAFFGATVLTPLWLQSNMGYTATWAGYATAATGVLAVMAAPMVANMSAKVDPRPLVFFGLMWLAGVTLYRSGSTPDMTYGQISLPLLMQGLGMPFFFVPLTGLALASVNVEETASAAGLMNFLRTLSGAFATSLVNTLWEDGATRNRAELVDLLRPGLIGDGLSIQQLDNLVQGQGVMLATNQIFLGVAVAFALSALVIWLAPKPTRVADTTGVH
ncbi:DHA2 family efflux MFS transporter permease subunit [Nitrospirillum sp. BR 11828]|uniref:DHA2 family efflux MFS transporter permease subunit n=1 Tax=Nitrospirillum sp. BR 11828 TaxID=3104325 RepID=UPI002ACA6A7D|nr:DHA2 family efflux MFS transporter permease subunit [Nitrospirillum sp. BR 11828]MDZ5649260.1 DHA2 family efflux MFS transporter permease subunit [Nitrospirillum sp. BR 11828]